MDAKILKAARRRAVAAALAQHRESEGADGIDETMIMITDLTRALVENSLALLYTGLDAGVEGVPVMALAACIEGDPDTGKGRSYTQSFIIAGEAEMREKLYGAGHQYADQGDRLVAVVFFAESWMIKRRIEVESMDELTRETLPKPSEQPDKQTVIVVMVDNLVSDQRSFYVPCRTDDDGKLWRDGELVDLEGESAGANIDHFWRGYYEGLQERPEAEVENDEN